MSKSKKATSTANIPRSTVTDPTYPMGDNRSRMAATYGDPASNNYSHNPLEQIEIERRQDLLKEYRDAKAKKEELRLQREIEQMKADTGVNVDGGGLNIQGMYNFTPGDIQAISKMGDVEQKAFYSTLQNIQMMAATNPRGGAQGLGNPILQMMAMGGFNRQEQQGLKLTDILEMQKMYATIYGGAGNQNQELTNTLLMKLMTDTVPSLQKQASDNMTMAYSSIIKNLEQNQSDPLRDLEYAKKLSQSMGYGPQSQSTEIAKLRIDMENQWRSKEWETKQKELEYRRNMGIIEKVLDTVQGVTKNVSRDHIREFFGPKTVQTPPTVQVQPVVATQQTQPVNPLQARQGIVNQKSSMNTQQATVGTKIIEYPCQKCGAKMYAPEGQSTVICSSCGQRHEAGG